MNHYYRVGDEYNVQGSGNVGRGNQVNQWGGHNVNVSGDHNVGIQNQASADPQAAFREMIKAVQALREQVSAADRQVIDESMDAICTDRTVEKGTLRRALRNIAGIATMVGQVGVPVIESVHAVMAAFSL